MVYEKENQMKHRLGKEKERHIYYAHIGKMNPKTFMQAVEI